MTMRQVHTGDEVRQRIETLPLPVQWFLYSHEMAVLVEQVGEKNHLHLDQMGALETEVADVILGFTEPNDFPEFVGEALGISEDEAHAVSGDVDALLFQHVRELVRTATPEARPVGVVGGGSGGGATETFTSHPSPLPVTIPPLGGGRPGGGSTGEGVNPRPLTAIVPPADSRPLTPIVPPKDTVSFADTALVRGTESVIKTVDVVPSAAAPVAKKYAVDPYREPIG